MSTHFCFAQFICSQNLNQVFIFCSGGVAPLVALKKQLVLWSGERPARPSALHVHSTDGGAAQTAPLNGIVCRLYAQFHLNEAIPFIKLLASLDPRGGIMGGWFKFAQVPAKSTARRARSGTFKRRGALSPTPLCPGLTPVGSACVPVASFHWNHFNCSPIHAASA